MEFKAAVGSRRTVRRFEPDRPVEKAKIRAILEAAAQQSQHGNAQLVRKAVVVTKGETPDAIRDALIDALYNQPQAAAAPVAIVWVQDMSGWNQNREKVRALLDARPPAEGWEADFADSGLAPEDLVIHPDTNSAFTEWLTSFECGLAVGSALLAAVDAGLGTGLITGRREEIRKMFDMPASCTPTQVQLVGYAAQVREPGPTRPRPGFDELYFADTWGRPLT